MSAPWLGPHDLAGRLEPVEHSFREREEEEDEEEAEAEAEEKEKEANAGLRMTSVQLDNEENDEDDELASLPNELLANDNSAAAKTTTQITEMEHSSNNSKRQPAKRKPFGLVVSGTSGNSSLGKQFNRLDPNRRSFSNPTVNLASACKGASSASTASSVASNAAQATRDSYKWRQQRVAAAAPSGASCPPSSASVATSPSSVAANGKLRRRTALGLISFGSAHFRFASSSQTQATGPNSCNSPPATAAAATTTSPEQQAPKQANWRAWFLGGGLGKSPPATVGNQTQPAEEDNARRRQQLVAVANSKRQQQQFGAATCTLDADQQQVAPDSSRAHLVGAPDTTGATAGPTQQATKDSGEKSAKPEATTTIKSRRKDTNKRKPYDNFKSQTTSNLAKSSISETSKQAGSASRLQQPQVTPIDPQQQQDTKSPATTIAGTTTSDSTGSQITTEANSSDTSMPSATQVKSAAPARAELAIEQQQASSSSSLVDQLIDSKLEWRRVIREANGGADCLSGLSELQLKRQEVIHELVQTERHHCLTLALMRQVYLSGLLRLNEARSVSQLRSSDQLAPLTSASNSKHHLKSTSALIKEQQQWFQLEQQQQPSHQQPGNLVDLERLFPALEDLIQAHELFFAHLRLRLVDSCRPQQQAAAAAATTTTATTTTATNSAELKVLGSAKLLGLVGRLGDLLCDQFRLRRAQAAPTTSTNSTLTTANLTQSSAANQANGHKLLQAYAKFCGQHYDSNSYYKYLMQNDKGFKKFIEACNKQHAACRQRGLPECYLLVSQRLTKYPLLIEQLIKTSKDDPDEEAKLQLALAECKALLAELNEQLARKQSFERLLDIYAHFCPKSHTLLGRRLKFTKHHLLQHKRLRQLIHCDGQISIQSMERGKLLEVLCLILNDIIVFLKVGESNSSATGSSAGSHSAASGCPALGASVGSSAGQPPPPQLAHLADWFQQPQAQLHHSLDNNSTPGDHHQGHQQQHAPLSQCSLINVLASAFQSSCSVAHQAPAAQPSSLNVASQTYGGSAASGFHHQTHHHGSLSSMAQVSQAPPPQELGGGLNVKYQFANIDHKPSVISLGKLLIREKAAIDREPRTYLVSNNSRQPEIYELAFKSKRHQDGFKEKLKRAIEQYNRLLESGELFVDDDEQLELLHDLNSEEDERTEDDEFAPAAQQENPSEEEEEHDEDDEEFRGEAEDDDQEAELSLAFKTPQCAGRFCRGECQRSQADSNVTREQQNSSSSSCSSSSLIGRSSTNNISTRTVCCRRTATTTADKQRFRRRANTLNGDFDFELDIEQDVVPEPARSFDVNNGCRTTQKGAPEHATANDSVATSFDYSTPIGCCVNSNRQQCNANPVVATSSAKFGAGSGSSCGDTADERAALASNESGLSERAKDSMDEFTSAAGQYNGKQKLRGARRRRPQRPRQVSNQSSSSSEAAHLQAIQMIASSAGAQMAPSQIEPAPADCEEEFDSGRGQDDFSSAASTSSNSLELSRACRSTSEGLAPDGDHKQAAVHSSQRRLERKSNSKVPNDAITTISIVTDKSAAHSASKSGCSCSLSGRSNSSDGSSSNTKTEKMITATMLNSTELPGVASRTDASGFNGGRLLKCSSILCKSKCPLAKQRKLSTVSTMSSQLKLLNRLKSGLVDAGEQFCSNCRPTASGHRSQHQSVPAGGGSQVTNAGSVMLSKQMRQQMRRTIFNPEQKLEELRDLRIQLEKDKQEWQAKFDKMQEQLLNERRELDLAREKLKQERCQVADEREQLYRKLDVLKENGIMLSPSHKVIITTPKVQRSPPDQQQQQQQQMEQHYLPNAAAANQRAPLQQMNVNNLNQQMQQQQQQARHLAPHQHSFNHIQHHHHYNHHHPTANVPNHQTIEHYHQHQPSSLYVQPTTPTIANKVPLHLANDSSASQQTNTSSNRWPSLGPPMISKVPLIGSLGATLGASIPFGSKPTTQPVSNTESHLI